MEKKHFLRSTELSFIEQYNRRELQQTERPNRAIFVKSNVGQPRSCFTTLQDWSRKLAQPSQQLGLGTENHQ